jgi:hypothetical protein
VGVIAIRERTNYKGLSITLEASRKIDSETGSVYDEKQAQQAQINTRTQAQLGNLLAQLLGNMPTRGNASGNQLKYAFLSKFKNICVIDSGATYHITGNLNLLKNTVHSLTCPPVIVANGTKVPIERIGTTNLLSNIDSDVLYLQTFTSNLLSVK